LHRPSAATVISLIALFFALGGTAVAATGGAFILGKANTATSVSSLTNTKGTALSLSSPSATPPLTVSNSVQVQHLNASQLGGHPAGQFVQGGGTSRSFGFMMSTSSNTQAELLSVPGFETLKALCSGGSSGIADVAFQTGPNTIDRFSAAIANMSTVDVGNQALTPNTPWFVADASVGGVTGDWQQKILRYTTGSGRSLTTHTATVTVMLDVNPTTCDFDASAIIGPGVTGP
jgi:hypothetical protein